MLMMLIMLVMMMVLIMLVMMMVVGVPRGDTVFSYKFNFKVVTRVTFVCVLYFLAAFISC